MVHCPRRIYQYQQFGYSFSTVEQLLHAMGGDGFLTLANQTLEEAMLGEGFSQVFLNNIVAPITRVNYGQSVRVNGFVGMPLPLRHTRLREGSSRSVLIVAFATSQCGRGLLDFSATSLVAKGNSRSAGVEMACNH